jgi:hypothetical protein
MARPTTLPEQATPHAADQAQDHLPTQLPPQHEMPVFTSITNSGTLPNQALTNAADQAHLPTELPPIQSHEVTLPDPAVDHMPNVAANHLPDWFIV